MDFREATATLGLQPGYTDRELKKAYYRLALRYHPDKNSDGGAADKFRDVNTAYEHLKGCKYRSEETDTSYQSLLKRCLSALYPGIKWQDIFVDTSLQGMLKGCEAISMQVFSGLEKDRAFEVFRFLSEGQDMLGVPGTLIAKMRVELERKMKDDNLVILNPSLEDILNDKIYKLEICGECFYVPLWHHEVCYDISGSDLIVKCIPELDAHIRIDNDNDIHCRLSGAVAEVLRDGGIDVRLGEHTLRIPGQALAITKYQSYSFKGAGMLKVNDDNLYDASVRGDVFVEIRLSE